MSRLTVKVDSGNIADLWYVGKDNDVQQPQV